MFMWLTNLVKHEFMSTGEERDNAARSPLAKAAVVAQVYDSELIFENS